MTDFFEPQLRYTRTPVDPEVRRQAELEVKRKEAEQLRLSGARVVFNEEIGTLRYEWNGNPLNLINRRCSQPVDGLIFAKIIICAI
jgi:hypothetical protein